MCYHLSYHHGPFQATWFFTRKVDNCYFIKKLFRNVADLQLVVVSLHLLHLLDGLSVALLLLVQPLKEVLQSWTVSIQKTVFLRETERSILFSSLDKWLSSIKICRNPEVIDTLHWMDCSSKWQKNIFRRAFTKKIGRIWRKNDESYN